MSQAAQLAQYGANNVGLAFKNRLINGNMVIDQRNAGASVTPTVDGTLTLDRWKASLSQASKFSVQQTSTAPTGFVNSLKVTSASAYSVLSADYFLINQQIEGYNCADLMWGTANAQTVTISFWVNSSLNGTFGGAISNSSQARSYPFTYTISASNTWEYKTVTIPGDTSGTWLTTSGIGIWVLFGLGVGTTYSGTAGAWAGALYVSATGATSVVGTSGATFYITGVQLEKGTVATSYDYLPYSTQLSLCQRYFARVFDPAMRGVATGGTAGGASRMALFFPQTMRTAPTLTATGTFNLWNGNNITTSTGLSAFYPGGNNSLDMDFNMSAAYTVGQAVCAYATNSTAKYIDLNSEF